MTRPKKMNWGLKPEYPGNMTWKMLFEKDSRYGPFSDQYVLTRDAGTVTRKSYVRQAHRECRLGQPYNIDNGIVEVEALVNKERAGLSKFGKEYGHLVKVGEDSSNKASSPTTESSRKRKQSHPSESERPAKRAVVELERDFTHASPPDIQINSFPLSPPIFLSSPTTILSSPPVSRDTNSQDASKVSSPELSPSAPISTTRPEEQERRFLDLMNKVDQCLSENKSLTEIIKSQQAEIFELKNDGEKRKQERDDLQNLIQSLIAQSSDGIMSRIASLDEKNGMQDNKIQRLSDDAETRKTQVNLLKSTEDRVIVQTGGLEHVQTKLQGKIEEARLHEKAIEVRVAKVEKTMSDYLVWRKKWETGVTIHHTKIEQLIADPEAREIEDSSFRTDVNIAIEKQEAAITQLKTDAEERKLANQAFEKGIEDRIEARLLDIIKEDAVAFDEQEARIKDLEREREKHAGQIATLQAITRLKNKGDEKST